MSISPVIYDYQYVNDRLHVVKTQDVEPILKTIHHIPDMISMTKLAKSGLRYIGSIPNVIALEWAKESGTRLYSREWIEYANKKLKSNEFSKLKVQY